MRLFGCIVASLYLATVSKAFAAPAKAARPWPGWEAECLNYLGRCPVSGKLSLAPVYKQDQTSALGGFTLRWHAKTAQLEVTHPAHQDGAVWRSVAGRPFVSAGSGTPVFTENHGGFIINDSLSSYCSDQQLDTWSVTADSVTLTGHFTFPGCGGAWTLVFALVDAERLHFQLQVGGGANHAFLTYESGREEHFFGFGEQYSVFDMKGRAVPIFAMEQGIGRGAEPITSLLNLSQGAGVAGSWSSTYAPVPQYMSSQAHSLFLENSEYSLFDLRSPEFVRITVLSDTLSGQMLAGDNPRQLLEEFTRYSGRMQPLPSWVERGAIVGLQGGTATVRERYQALKAAGVKISALWLQDWVGRRQTALGSQLWWNWVLNTSWYPNWDDLVAELGGDAVRVLTYINPMPVDASSEPGATRNLYKEAAQADYLVRNAAGDPYQVNVATFPASMLDFTRPEAAAWTRHIIQDEMLRVGSSGWMADFGEALPLDAKLAAGAASRYHNDYPVAWAQVNHDACTEVGAWEDTLIFSRSGFTKSPGVTRLFWLGDQLVTWDAHDGLQTALTGLLSSGLSGFALNHSDTGGYTTINGFGGLYQRSKELLQRWTEMNAFTAVLRTHEGNIPESNQQVYTDSDTMAHFAKFSRVYEALAPYRRELEEEAAATGMPLVRPLFLHYPNDHMTYSLTSEFLLGSELLIAPVLNPSWPFVRVYLPEPGWRQLATGVVMPAGYHSIYAPIGQPAVFYRSHAEAEAPWLEALTAALSLSSAAKAK